MHSLLRWRHRKAQFFILSAFVIVTALFVISKTIEPHTLIDTSEVILLDDFFIFNNIREKAKETVRMSKNCEELKFNVEEFVEFVKRYSFERGKLMLEYKYISPCCDKTTRYEACKTVAPGTPAVVEFNLTIVSPEVEINDIFYESYTPEST